MPVGGELVGACAEHQSEGPGQRQVETAVAAHPAGGSGHRSARPVVAVVPSLGGVDTTQLTQQPPAAQSQLVGDLVDRRVTGRGEAGHKALVLGRRGEQVAGPEVTGAEPVIPWHPLGRQQRRRPRHQHHFADRRVVGTRMRRHHHGPLPALIAGQVGQETMGGGSGVVERRAEILADGVTAVLDDRRARQIDGARQHRLQVRRRLDRRRRRAVLGGFRHAVHVLNSA